MGSQLDLDQGGTFRTRQRIQLGPSVGPIEIPSAVLRVTVGGTTNVALGNSVVTVNFNGAVTLQLPVFRGTASGAIAVPGPFYNEVLTIVDTGGFAGAFPITILPGGAELIDGQASISLNSPYGAYALLPDTINGGAIIIT